MAGIFFKNMAFGGEFKGKLKFWAP